MIFPQHLNAQAFPVIIGAAQAPVFNFPGEKQRRFCYDHKLPGMVNLRRADKRPRSAPAPAPLPPLPVSCPAVKAVFTLEESKRPSYALFSGYCTMGVPYPKKNTK